MILLCNTHALLDATGESQVQPASAVQGITVVCSLLYRLDEEARALEVATEV